SRASNFLGGLPPILAQIYGAMSDLHHQPVERLVFTGRKCEERIGALKYTDTNLLGDLPCQQQELVFVAVESLGQPTDQAFAWVIPVSQPAVLDPRKVSEADVHERS